MTKLINQEASESDFLVGMIKKKKYRKRWVKNVKKLPDHPFNNGIHMDTHHLISAEAVKHSELGEILVKKGYDINQLSNLVGFPATLPGACQLHCQLHRGDHTYMRPEEKPYHRYVSAELRDPEIRKKINNCYGKTKKTEDESEIHKILDPISEDILDEINFVVDGEYYSLPLTKISHYFIPGGPGCACQFEVNDAEKHHGTFCSNARLHYKNNDRDGKDKRYQPSRVPWNTKTITFRSTRWTPEVGK
ncbi:AHH domain-containing protein [Vibrio sp. Sgm 5]|uniref:AHH domain-containing protein n=1 Tax=Vibrio sp. Sgm 5 TaxID=2994387 RepID=UPI002248A4DE|nr:AHH domain-containing protein [Vibrio sp. Sgm 5]MCX2788203.1 AHH domain-containing protein [Vibrio sp. Sgm 5]